MIAQGRILLLTGPGGISPGYRSRLNDMMKRVQLNLGLCYVKSIHDDADLTKEVKVGKRVKKVFDKKKFDIAEQALWKTVSTLNPTFILCNDAAAASVLAGDRTGASLSQCRGSIYDFHNIKALVIDDLARLNDTQAGVWILQNDLLKLARYLTGNLRHEPAFNLTICDTLQSVQAACEALENSAFITTDVETRDNWITCVGYTGLVGDRLQTYVIPVFTPLRADGAYWDTAETETQVWQYIRRINASPAIKILQNGSYDSAIFLRYHAPLINYFIDTMHLWHCLFAELPKRIDFIASLLIDNYTFWKEESKGVKQENVTTENLFRFWQYCGLDCHYTTLCAIHLLNVVVNTPWALQNYAGDGKHNYGQFARQIGPALHMSCRGLCIDPKELERLSKHWEEEKEKRLHKLRIMVDDPEFNPNSTDQVGQLFYKVLGAQPVKIRGKIGATDEATLKSLGDQHPLFKIFADAVLEAKEPGTLLSNFIHFRRRRNRFMYSMATTGTETSRFSSGPFLWEGRNAQNVSDELRSYIIADDGYVLFDIDLEQSDARYVAYESQDQKFISNVESGKDTHCLHAAHFFKESYEHIYEQVQAKVVKYAHKVTGVRALTKRIVHGANYQMAAATLYHTMGGREAVIAAAHAIGIRDAHMLPMKGLIKICEIFLEDYHVLYPRLRPWYKEIETELRKHRRLTTAFGWTRQFFGAPDDAGVQREATAFFGQGDTAGNINRAIDFIYYGEPGSSAPTLESQGVRLLLQVHDSLVGEVPVGKMHLLREIVRLLELPVYINGRAVCIPAAIKVGSRWGDKNLTELKLAQLTPTH